jgi:chromosome segregation ATPase
MSTPAADSPRHANPQAGPATDAAQRELAAVTREAARLRRERSLAQADSLRSARALLDVEAQLALANARIADLEQLAAAREQQLAALSGQLERAARVSASVHSSLSWRITAPLRALKRRA